MSQLLPIHMTSSYRSRMQLSKHTSLRRFIVIFVARERDHGKQGESLEVGKSFTIALNHGLVIVFLLSFYFPMKTCVGR
jgi:hypothetical protein